MSLSLLILTLTTSMVLGAPPAPCPPGQTPVPVTVVEGNVRTACRPIGEDSTKAPASDLERYTDMEKATPRKVSEFRGGDAVIYISTGAAIVIVVVLLILLL